MKEEIKNILDIEGYRNKDGYVEDISLTPDEIQKLLDYITNLQEENDKLQGKKDKAVEYIKMNKYYEWHTERDEHGNIQPKKIETTLVNGSKLMDILQGSDKE